MLLLLSADLLIPVSQPGDARFIWPKLDRLQIPLGASSLPKLMLVSFHRFCVGKDKQFVRITL